MLIDEQVLDKILGEVKSELLNVDSVVNVETGALEFLATIKKMEKAKTYRTRYYLARLAATHAVKMLYLVYGE